MRLFLLGLIFLLLLTLGNAVLMARQRMTVTAHDYAAVQIPSKRVNHYEWDAFVWREIAAIILTMLVFGAIASTGDRS